MALHWLVYRQGSTRCVVIERASSLIQARLNVSLRHAIEPHAFVEAFELPGDAAVPAHQVSRILTAPEAATLLTRLRF